jgi:hypothetical protein
MLLKDAIKEAKEQEKKYRTHKLIYKVYDPIDDYELVYIGMGGLNHRKGSGRLIEHSSTDNFSSFKSKYLMSCLEKYSRVEFQDCINNYDNLRWEIETYPRHYTPTQVKQIEDTLIRENSPKYNIKENSPKHNISKNSKDNETYNKFFE